MLNNLCQTFFELEWKGLIEMSSATKTLELLAYFSTARPEIGLSQLYKLAQRDKATTYRHLQALEETGFVEQNPMTKQYRLGPAILQLAQTREATVPRKAGVEAPLFDLANATGETSRSCQAQPSMNWRRAIRQNTVRGRSSIFRHSHCMRPHQGCAPSLSGLTC